jgi:hypothetical protein
MPKVKTFSEEDILIIFRDLSRSKKKTAMEFLEFLDRRFAREKKHDIKKAVSAVEDTWGSISLDKKTLKYIAEDKELEYDI